MLKRSSITSKLLFVLGAAFGMTTTVGVERAQADIWSGWEHLGTPSTPSGAGILETPNCVSWQARRIDCFARGADRAMWHRWFDGRAWHGWESLGGEILEVPNCVSWKTRRIDCFARGTDQAMYHRWFDGNAWRGWDHLGAPSTPSGAGVLETPNCVSWQARRIDCFARGADRAMWHRWFDGNAWRGWENLGGPEPERIILDAPNCVSWEAHRIDCFARGADQAMHHRWFDGSAWRGWENLGGPAPEGVILDAPNCVSWEAHRIDCFARGAGRVMWHRWFDRGAWLGWEYLGAPSTHSGAGIVETSILETPNCVSSEARRIDCFARGADQAMHHSSFDGNAWRGWENLGGPGLQRIILEAPNCVSWGANRIDCFGRGGDRALWHQWFSCLYLCPLAVLPPPPPPPACESSTPEPDGPILFTLPRAVHGVSQCPAPQPGDVCGAHCIVDIKENLADPELTKLMAQGDCLKAGGVWDANARKCSDDPRLRLNEALQRCNTTVRLGPDIDLDFSDEIVPELLNQEVCELAGHKWATETGPCYRSFRPLLFSAACVTLTSVSALKGLEARTPRTLGPVLHYGPADRWGGGGTFLKIACPPEKKPASDRIRISGFRLFGPSFDQQVDSDVGISIDSCVDVEISNMEIAGWGSAGILVGNGLVPRINDFSQIRIHDNFIHHNQHPSEGGHALGYGVEVGGGRVRAHIYRNVFDFNRHAIAAQGRTGGYVAEENLVLKGGGYHGGGYPYGTYTHIFDVHGVGDNGLGGDAGEEFRIERNSFQYASDSAIHIRGRPRNYASIAENIFTHECLRAQGIFGVFGDCAIRLWVYGNVPKLPNVLKTDTYGEYGVCDFDGDGIDDLFLATGATWWYSSSGEFQWSFLNTSSKRKKDLRLGYFDDDSRCDVLTESGGSGRWVISSGGTGAWTPLESLHGGIERGFRAPLKDVVFGRFNPNDNSHSRRTTHAFWRKQNGEWHVTPLWNPDGWEYVRRSRKPMSQLRFGDFTGDGVTDVLAVDNGRWAISESARTQWHPLNRYNEPVAGLFIANMDRDDGIDDILRLDKGNIGELIWWRSKNGREAWTEFKRYSPNSPLRWTSGFVGRFGPMSGGGTLAIDQKRIGHFFSPGNATEDWTSRFPY